MKFWERQIELYERRIKRVEQNPDPTRLRANKLGYQLHREQAAANLEAWRQGRPFMYAPGSLPSLARAMGFELVTPSGTLSARSQEDVSKAFDILRSMNMPDNTCDITLMAFVMQVTGEYPRPALVAIPPDCEIAELVYKAVAHYLDAPLFCIHAGLEINNETLRYVTNQLGELIEFAESTVPGIKYDEDKLAELQEYDRIAYGYWRDIHQLKKRVPCPVSGIESFTVQTGWLPSRFPEPKKVLEYLRAYRDEVGERAEKGIVPVAEERLRVMWAVSGPTYFNFFRILEQRGASVPVFYYGYAARVSGVKYGVYGDEKEYGRKLSPLEEEARMMNGTSWSACSERWIEDAIALCEDLRIDAIVNFLQVGCVMTLGAARLLADEVKRRLGIPTLQIPGRALQGQSTDQIRISEALEQFIDICLARKEA